MAWKDKLRPASFRGVPFFIDSSQFTSGRRVTFHEFPNRDKPFAEDLGKVGSTFKVEGHILGDDYFDIKQRLIEATSDTFGPGELIHPYFGTKSVQCGAFSIDEDNREGGIAKVSFQFYEAGDNTFPQQIDDKQSVLAEKSQAALDASKAEFDEKFSVEQLPGFAVDTARGSVGDAADTFENATKGIKTEAARIADLAFNIRNLRAETDDLLQSPASLSSRLSGSFGFLKDACSLSRGKYQAVSAFSSFGKSDPVIQQTTPIREKQAENKTTFDNFMRRSAVANAAVEAAQIDFVSVEEATTYRNQLRDLIDDILLTTEDDNVFQAFKDLNAQITKMLPDVDADLPNVQKVTTNDTSPSLVLAYDLFQTPEVEQDLIDRNNIRHPGFVLGDSELEVIDVRSS